MNTTLYLSLISFKKKYVALLLVQLVFMGGIGFSVYTYDQFYPDQPLGDDQIMSSTTTSDQKIHWLDKNFPVIQSESDLNSIDPSILKVHTMDTDNEITSIGLTREDYSESRLRPGIQRNGISALDDDLVVLSSYAQISPYPLIFRISNPGTDPIVEAAVLELPKRTGFIDYYVDELTDSIVVSSVDLSLWGTWADLITASVTHEKFLGMLDRYNYKTYLSEYPLDSVNWQFVGDQVPIDINTIYSELYNLDNFTVPDLDYSSFGLIREYHRDLATQLRQTDDGAIADIIKKNLVEPTTTDDYTSIQGLYLLSGISRDENQLVYGQGLSVINTEGNLTITSADYFVIDTDNELVWSWDLRDIPTVTYVFDKVTTRLLDETVFFFNSDVNLDIRNSQKYDNITSDYGNFVDWYYDENTPRSTYQLAWFDPVQPSLPTHFVNISSIIGTPESWVDITDKNYNLNLENSEPIQGSIYPPFPFYNSQLLSYIDNNGETHLHIAFSNIPSEYEIIGLAQEHMGIYSYDVSMDEFDGSPSSVGQVTALREPTGNIDRDIFVKNGLISTITARQVDGKVEILYFYLTFPGLDFIDSRYMMIVDVGGRQDE